MPAARRNIQSIGVGFRLVRALMEARRPLPLKQLAAAAQMSASKAHPYLASFVQLGLLTQSDTDGRYALGPTAMELGLAAIDQNDVVALGAEPMETLRAATGETVYLTVWGNRGPCIVRRVEGIRETPLSIRVGYVLPLTTSATGRTFLAHLPATMTQRLRDEERERLPLARGIDPAALDAVLDEVRREHFATTKNQVFEGFGAVAAPVFNHEGKLAAAMSIVCPNSALDPRPEGPLRTALRAATETLSHRLGHRGEA